MKAKLLSMILALVMIVSILPTNVLAVEMTFVEDSFVTLKKEEYNQGHIDLYFTINENAPSEVTIGDIGRLVSKLISEINVNSYDYHTVHVEPGVGYYVTVHIKNNSPYAFAYKNNGMRLDTVAETDETLLTNFVGYDGKRIPLTHVGNIEMNIPAIADLYIKSQFKAKSVFDLYTNIAQNEYGYTGQDALSRFLLAEYFQKKHSDVTDWNDLKEKYHDELFDELLFDQAHNPSPSGTNNGLTFATPNQSQQKTHYE